MLPEILGCYLSRKREKMGRVGSGREFTQRIEWLALRLPPDRILIFPMGENHLPLPLQKTVSPEDFLEHFLPEPALFRERLAPAAGVLTRLLRDGGGQPDQAALPEAEQALYAVLLTAVAASGTKDAPTAVRFVLAATAATPSESDHAQKHVINAFGIHLRKQGDYETAIAYYRKALELAPSDERLLFNLARALFEKGDLPGCHSRLEQALRLAPDFAEAERFLSYLEHREAMPPGGEFPDITL